MELVVALGISALLSASLAGLVQVQLKSAHSVKTRGETWQSLGVAWNWLRRDLQSARSVVVAPDGRTILLERPKIKQPGGSYLYPTWEQVAYTLVDKELRRSVNNSHNPVAEGITSFQCKVRAGGQLAAVTLAGDVNGQPLSLTGTVWLRNVGTTP
ncbi:MAG TPA: hypothetical protein GX511_04935 [Firmicutes bacterium]|nr:hypothetical protein [Bacillota bacterium]